MPLAIASVEHPMERRCTRPIRLGVVSFVNALPLIDGLENLRDIELCQSVPSQLVDRLVGRKVDVALCSSIDFHRSTAPLQILPVGLLGCDGPTLTVRLYSAVPIGQLRRVHCDIDSHTSVALLRILLREIYRIEPEFIDFNTRQFAAEDRNVADGHGDTWPQAMLLIGDKVVTNSPPAGSYPHQLDLGATWVAHTGLPFVFALWMARRDADTAMLATAAAVLDRQRRHNLERIDWMIHHRARARGWPADVASDYLKQHIAYEVTEKRLAGLNAFFEKACQHGLIEGGLKAWRLEELIRRESLSTPHAAC
jgi:chorismate dehydratase